MNWKKYISSDPKVMYGKPVVKGTRIPVDLILERLSEGESIDQILEAYPNIDRKVILACISYATSSVRNETLFETSE